MARVESRLRAATFAMKEPLKGQQHASTRAMRFQAWFDQSIYARRTTKAGIRAAWRHWQEQMSHVPLATGYTSH